MWLKLAFGVVIGQNLSLKRALDIIICITVHLTDSLWGWVQGNGKARARRAEDQHGHRVASRYLSKGRLSLSFHRWR